MTLLKYAVSGNHYLVLFGFDAAFTVLAGRVWL